jgi:hypothetical protein
VVLHWFGSPDGASDHSRCDDLMRAVQRGHLNHPTEPYVDIAYNHCVCPHGGVFEGRGFMRQSGANGTSYANRNYAALCVMLGKNNPPAMFSPAAQRAVVGMIRLWQQYGAEKVVKPHGYFTGSECPGSTIRAWMASAPWKTTTTGGSMTIPEWLDDWLRWVVLTGRDPSKRPANVPEDLSGIGGIWDLAVAVQRIAWASGMSEEEESWIRWRRAGAKLEDRPASLPAAIPEKWWDDLAFVNTSTGG